jgi:pimeloyl-ACP methyl ester carboxylesterase
MQAGWAIHLGPAAVPWETMNGTITRDDVTIAYEVTAPPAPAGTVVLLHNIFCDRRVFDQVVETLRPRHRTIAIDFRGHGQSGLGQRPYAVADLVADVVAVLDREEIGRAVVVGLSLGATVALELALAHPDRVERLVLMGADADPDQGMTAFRNGLFCRLVMLLGMRWFVLSAVTTTLFGKWFRTQAVHDFGVHRDRIAAMPPRAAARAMRAWTGRRPLREAAAAVRIPTRIVVGDQDVSCPLPCGERLQQAIPGAELVRIPDAGHTMTAERPRDSASAIASFLG